MKKEYVAPEIEVVVLPEDDILLASGQSLTFDKFNVFSGEPDDNWFS